MMKQSKGLAWLLIMLTVLFILTAAIAVPILFRPFYYWQIGPLGIEVETGLPREEIIRAYQEMLDFCTGLTSQFSTGILQWSESGRDHFVDVRRLFLLDLGVAGSTGVSLLIWRILRRRLRIRPSRLGGRSPGFWAGAGMMSSLALVGLMAALDFDKAFELFHALFFPGKSNWIFDARTDEIIRILPQAFFRNCGILILAIILAVSGGLMAADLRRKRSRF